MKKSLVALAVLAASGASFAQVTVTGNLTAGFSQTNAPASITSGFGVDTAEVTFGAKEDLGGGMKAGASLGLVNVVRGAATTNGITSNGTAGANTGVATSFGPANTSVYVSGDFGKITLATARGTDYLTGGVAAVGGTYQDGRALSARDTSDSVAYAMTAGPMAISLTYSEPTNSVGLGLGTSGTAMSAVETNQRSTAIGLRYTDGPLVADAGYAMYDEGATPTNAGDKSDARVAGSYDLGAVKLGGGWRQRAGKAGTRTDMGVAASVPMGALTLGANWVQREYNNFRNSTGKDGVNIGYGVSANYALSKRTSFIADYTAYTTDSARTQMTSVYNLFLSHSF